ncbi:MAG: glycosyltransferase [Neisseria sp.]|nr:glycosyltransferase [Neisseria sp.]
MNIAIVAPFCSLPGEAYFNRFLYLAERLAERHEVTLITSQFRHHDKTFRNPADFAAPQGRLNIRLLAETGYRKNVSLQRVLSHRAFVRRLAQEVAAWQTGRFDAVYSAYPLIASNLVLAQHKKRVGYKLIIDVQDVWPESFSAVLPLAGKLPPRLLPFARRADRAYAAADALAAVSHTYLARAQAANPNVPAEAVYIGADMDAVAEIVPHRFPANGTLRLFYLGTLSYSYDLATICRAVDSAFSDGLDVELHIIGGGPDETRLRGLASERVHFHGYLPYAESIALAKGCDVAVNPIHGYAPQSITNKLSDYMALGKPILNSQLSPEARTVIEMLPHAHYPSGDAAACAAAIRQLANRPPEQTAIPEAVCQAFNRRRSYQKLIDLIENSV